MNTYVLKLKYNTKNVEFVVIYFLGGIMKIIKTFATVLVLCATFSSALAFVACGAGNSTPSHTHTFGEWESDGNSHWKECPDDHEVSEKSAHKAGDEKQENVVAADVLSAGSYDAVTYCTVCSRELTRKTVSVSATGYPKGEADVWDGSADIFYAAGDGTKSNPYLIASAKQFALFANTVNEGNNCKGIYYSLVKDINLNGNEWLPIANKGGASFAGYFDGKGYTVSNYKITATQYGFGGLFGNNSGTIVNLSVKNYTVNVSDNNSGIRFIGSLAAYNSGTIKYCYASGKVAATYNSDLYIGGLIGYNTESGTVSTCYATGDVSGISEYSLVSAGGLVGANRGYIGGSYATGNVSSSNSSASAAAIAGGVVGNNEDRTSTVNSCFATGDVEAVGSKWKNFAGGVIGSQNGSTSNNYRVSIQIVVGTTNNEGSIADLSKLKSKAFLNQTFKYDESIWHLNDGEFPTLKVFD